jgi:hypothetical protein
MKKTETDFLTTDCTERHGWAERSFMPVTTETGRSRNEGTV